MEPNETPQRKSFPAIVWGVLWRLVLIILIILGIRHVLVRITHKIRYKHETADYYTWNAPIAYGYKDRGTLYLYNLDTKKKISSNWVWLSDVPEGADSLAVFCKKTGWRGRNLRRGYFNANTGEVVIKPQYDHAWVFSEGLGAVTNGHNEVGFIDSDGHYVITSVFPYIEDVDYLFHEGYCMVPKYSGTSKDTVKFGAIDQSGQWVLQPQFDDVEHAGGQVYIIRKNGKYGLMDWRLQWLLQPEYDKLSVHSASERTLCATKGPVKQILTFEGKVLEPFIIDSMGTLRYETDDEEEFRLSDYMWYVVSDKMGVLDGRNGTVIIPAIFDDVNLITPNLFECEIDDCSYQAVLYDLQGRPLSDKLLKETEEKVNQ